ncbi:MAG: aconitase X swivel domain-containing protein [Candidatus Limnocylindria bacterium]
MTELRGRALVLDEPLSLWGGMDPVTGRLIDAHHPQRGAQLAGRVVVMSAGRGSSSSASVLAEAVRVRTAPLAIVLGEPDLILSIGSAVAEELYGRTVPIVVLAPIELAAIADGAEILIGSDGTVRRA